MSAAVPNRPIVLGHVSALRERNLSKHICAGRATTSPELLNDDVGHERLPLAAGAVFNSRNAFPNRSSGGELTRSGTEIGLPSCRTLTSSDGSPEGVLMSRGQKFHATAPASSRASLSAATRGASCPPSSCSGMNGSMIITASPVSRARYGLNPNLSSERLRALAHQGK